MRPRPWLTLSVLVLAAPVDAQAPDPHMAEWYLQVAPGCRLYVLELGRGADTVIVLHGGPGAEHSYLLPVFQGLEDQYHLVFYDQRGSLRSPCPDSLVTYSSHVEDLDRVRVELGLEHVTLAAHSAGTFLAMMYADRFPNRPKGLILFGALQPGSPKTAGDSSLQAASDSMASAFFKRPELAATLEREGLNRDRDRLSPRDQTFAWRIQFAAVNIVHIERWRSVRGGQVFYNSAAAAAAGRTRPVSYDYTASLAGLRCPVTIIAGDHDFVDMGAVMHRRWAGPLANVHLVVIPNAGHNAWIDAPDEFRRLLLQGLRRSADCR